MANRLKNESSPYLKQHENNPVDWFPWGEEALKLAKDQDKPILLSVGYSACHWCHVMAHESFENPAIAKIMNEHFVCIKVDREERPDLDQIYQPVAQLITKGGGWPLTVFLTSDLRPVYGGTYFPPADKYGRPGFPKLLLAVSQMYQQDRPEAERRAQSITDVIQNSEELEKVEVIVDLDSRLVIEGGLQKLLSHVDWTEGGIGSAPKFPNVSALNFLWKASLSDFGNEETRNLARAAVILALTKMRRGGIYDQIGGGFSRYSVDGQWSVPHFEKMLYDNALLLRLYSEVLLRDGKLESNEKSLFLSTILETLTYLRREMLSPEGLFYTAQDADSEGEEGKFFVWTREELQTFLTKEEEAVFSRAYGVTKEGNFEHGATVLFEAIPESHLTDQEKTLLFKAREKVFAKRETRVRPGLDDKILISWNALLLSGLSWAVLVLEKEKRTEASEWKAILKKAYAKLKEKKAVFLDDEAFSAAAALEMTRVFPEDRIALIQDALARVQTIVKDFSAPDELGFFFTSHGHEKLIHRPKSIYDQAIPSGSGVAYGVMAVLSAHGFNEFESKFSFDYSRLKTILPDQAFGLSETLTSLLLQAQGAISVCGEWEPQYRTHPFFYGSQTLTGTVQFCQNQTCVLDPKDLQIRL